MIQAGFVRRWIFSFPTSSHGTKWIRQFQNLNFIRLGPRRPKGEEWIAAMNSHRHPKKPPRPNQLLRVVRHNRRPGLLSLRPGICWNLVSRESGFWCRITSKFETWPNYLG